jgi:hypothetical protein
MVSAALSFVFKQIPALLPLLFWGHKCGHGTDKYANVLREPLQKPAAMIVV